MSRPAAPTFAWPLIALAVLVVGWIGYVAYLVVNGDRDPATCQLLAVRILAGILLLVAIFFFVRDRRMGSRD